MTDATQEQLEAIETWHIGMPQSNFTKNKTEIRVTGTNHLVCTLGNTLYAATSRKRARLIASAPDLLKALQVAAIAMECTESPFMHDEAAKARAVIAKATGA